MIKFLIVEADYPCGRGARGLNLYRFLTTYYDRQDVRLVSTRQLLRSRQLQAEVLFIGLPTNLSKQHLARVTYRQAVLFDYQDGAGPTWLDSDERLLRSLTDLYLKTWVEAEWDCGMRLGVLPIRQHFQLNLYLRGQQLLRRLGHHPRDERAYDIAFVGEATAYQDRMPQRIHWVREIKSAGNRYSFWGGIATRRASRPMLQEKYPDLQAISYRRGRMNFLTHLSHLARARVALAPAGNARWTYRHYESVYAGAIVVSTDFRRTQMLIPLPLHNMVQVADHAPVLPAIDEALWLRERRPEIVEENIRFLEQYLHYGAYCRQKPALMDRFHAQLAG